MMERQHGKQRFHAARAAQQVSGHGFGGIDREFAGSIAEGEFDGVGFVFVAQRGGSAMRVDVLHGVGIDAGIFQGILDAAFGAVSVGRGHVVGVAAHAEANQLGVDFRAARLGVFVFFQHQYARAFAHHEAIAPLVPGTARRGGVVIAGGQGARGGETGDAQGRNGGFRAACHHHVGIAVFDEARRRADGMGAGGAGSDQGDIRPLKTVTNREIAGDHVDDGAGHEEGRNLTHAGIQKFLRAFFDHGQTADAGADANADALHIFGVFQTGVPHRLNPRCHAVMNKGIHAAGVFGRDVRADIEIMHFPGNAAGESGSVEFAQRADAGLPRQDIAPCRFNGIAHGTDDAKAGNDHSAMCQLELHRT